MKLASKIVVVTGLALLLVPPPTLANDDDDGNDGNDSLVLVRFRTLFGVRGPYLSSFVPPTPLRGLNGAPGPWSVKRAAGSVKSDNPVPSFRAVVSCRSIDSAGNASIVNTSTADFPATPSGDADIRAEVKLPNPCVAPLVFVTSSSLIWLAVTGR
jgi:hypothetical protein